ncbi:MAG: tetratricopeptide repeat protein [Chloroflexota bacterium]|nr:tetratricopeptide repeat protein [Chloroflexota bacterium]
MAKLPSGTVTFLFTDIEGSTALWERHSEAMRAALGRHDAVLRDAIEARRGYIFKTMGDAVCAAFATAPDALAAAVAAQHALQAECWGDLGRFPVRMALHTGAAEARGGDYFGPSLSRVTRLVATGHGGQILLSQPTYDLVRDDLPAGASLRDLGEHRLKDLIRPEHVFQLVCADLPSEFPPLRTLDLHPHNLPVQPTPLLGREREVAAARERLLHPDVRLLTLTGPGGMGKTRLGLQVAADMVDHFGDGVFFVALAPISDIGLVAPTIAQTLGIRDAGARPLVETLQEFLRDRRMLLVLDNFEQVLGAAPVVADLLAASPGLKILLTSRAVLQVRGEHEFPVPPLALPDPKRPPPVEALSQYAAVRLFIERAAAVKPDFAISNENAPAVAEICARLDGLPLAIELAAARVRVLPPLAMLRRLERRLPLLTGGARDLPGRQQTLRGAIQWSYDLLTPEERRLFRRLAVFVGGCTLEAAEAVCNAEGDLDIDVLDGVGSLVAKSLLRLDEQGDAEPRLMMLETIREYALERLEATPGEAQALRRAHAEHYLAEAEDAERQFWDGGDCRRWLERLEREHDNLRAVLAWSQGPTGERELGLRLAGALWWFWFVHSHYTEGRRWLETTLATSDGVPASVRAKVLTATGQLERVQGDYDQGMVHLEQAAALCRDLGDERGLARALVELAFAHLFRGDDARAAALWEESLAVSRAAGNAWGEGASLHGLGRVAEFRTDYERSRALLEESLACFRRLGNEWYTAWSLRYLGRAVQALGDVAWATALLEESLALWQQQDNKPGMVWALHDLAQAARARGNGERAAALASESLALAREMGQKREIAEGLEELAELAVARGQPERAARLFGAAAALRETIGAVVGPNDRLEYDRAVATVRAALGEAGLTVGWAEGRALSLEQAVAYALATGASS